MPRTKKISKEEMDANMLASRLKDCYEDHINEPTIQYTVGQQVQYGCHYKAFVTDVIEGGKIIKLHVTSSDTKYGVTTYTESDTYVCWHDITPYISENDMKKIPIMSYREDYHLNYSQNSIRSILHYYYNFGIDMDPIYQRGNVWTMEDKVALIDSIFNNVDIGKFVLIHLPFKSGAPAYEVLDGKQRITALVEFYEGRYPYKGKTYYELHPRDQNHFDDYATSFARTEAPMTQEQKYKYFLKLNVGGKAQDPAHLAFVRHLYEKEKSS